MTLADDFQTATAEQRCLVMLVERVGALEDSMGRVVDMLGDLHRCMTTSYMYLAVPYIISGTPETLADIVAAAQQNRLIVVKHAWLVCGPNLGGGYSGVDVFLQLETCVVADQVSGSISDDVGTALRAMCIWIPVPTECCFQQKLQKKCEGKDGATRTVHEWDRHTSSVKTQ
jgi:hypothetical protein